CFCLLFISSQHIVLKGLSFAYFHYNLFGQHTYHAGAKMARQYNPPLQNDPILESRHPKEIAERHVEPIEYFIFLSQLSPHILAGLHEIAHCVESQNYQQGLFIHAQVVSSSNFSEVSSFMPILKAEQEGWDYSIVVTAGVMPRNPKVEISPREIKPLDNDTTGKHIG
ncbi:hypothetical protein AB205_0142470, partial [Aquarana catesbeiana]